MDLDSDSASEIEDEYPANICCVCNKFLSSGHRSQLVDIVVNSDSDQIQRVTQPLICIRSTLRGLRKYTFKAD
ncbi:hypothetical protein DPMN_107054 [Dreissena polymorpha]|uniref:Uncharacterized protein n=1 Tax=Dreissena polymorpha TaxID=45954 RepID=A0A9D4K632_DREPO|nr:hypothetical protein DPMN_107054 [Dreissena polymorpha]